MERRKTRFGELEFVCDADGNETLVDTVGEEAYRLSTTVDNSAGTAEASHNRSEEEHERAV